MEDFEELKSVIQEKFLEIVEAKGAADGVILRELINSYRTEKTSLEDFLLQLEQFADCLIKKDLKSAHLVYEVIKNDFEEGITINDH